MEDNVIPLNGVTREIKTPHYVTDFPVRYKAEGDGNNWNSGRVIEISLKGIKLETGVSLERETLTKAKLLLQLVVPSETKGETSLLVSGKIMGWYSENGYFRLDVLFDDMEEQEGYLVVDLVAYLLSEGKARSRSAMEKEIRRESIL